MTISGHIIGGQVNPAYYGATLTAALALGDTVLHVDDVADFDEDAAKRNAQVTLGIELGTDGNLDPATGSSLAYTTCDDEANTVTLKAASTVAAAAGDLVYIRNAVTGAPAGELEVMVAIDGGDTTGDALPATLDVGLLGTIGDVELTDQAVVLEVDEDDQLVIVAFSGLAQSPTGGVRGKALDSVTVTSLGDQTLKLTYRPIPQTEHLRWNGASQDFDDFSRTDWTVTIPDPDGVVRVGDKLTMQYLYTDPTPRPVIPASLLYIGTTNVAGVAQTRIPWPAGTQAGDLWVLTMYAGNGFGDAYARVNPIETRMVAEQLHDYDFGSAWPDHRCAAYGYAALSSGYTDWTLDPGLNIELFCSDRNIEAYLSTYRVTGDVSVTFPHGANTHTGPQTYPNNSVDVPGLFIYALATGADSQQLMETSGWTADYLPGVSGHGRWHAQDPTALHVDNAVNTPHEEFASWLAAMVRITEEA